MHIQRRTHRRRMKAVISIASSLLVGTLFLARAQNIQNKIEKYDWPNEPVRIVSLQVGKEKIALGKSFQGAEDWANSLRITVENTSGKSIRYLQLELRFSRTDDPNAGYSFFLEWPEPLQPDEQGRPHYSNRVLSAGEQATLSTHIKVAQTKASMAQLGRRVRFDRARLDVAQAAFEDGTLWGGGDYLPRRSGSLRPIHWGIR